MEFKNNIKDIFKKNHMLKLILSFIVLVFVTLYNNPRVKENLFYLIETKVFYREIPPVYTNKNFKNVEPNKICSILNKDKLISNSYARSKYFEFSCETGILVSPDSSWSIQYMATGKIFNIETTILKMKMIKPQNKFDIAKDFFTYTEKLFHGLGIYNMPLIAKQNILSLKDFSLKLDKNVSMNYYISDDEIILILN